MDKETIQVVFGVFFGFIVVVGLVLLFFFILWLFKNLPDIASTFPLEDDDEDLT